QDAGVAAIALHARTAADYYSGTAHWDAIATLKQAITEVPVLGNGDIWSAEDAQAMVAYTGCDGVVVGRGCQGRPWLFTDLVAAFAGSDQRVRPGLAEVAEVIRRHALLMVEHFGEERKALRELRKHLSWYMKGYVVGGEARRQLGLVSTLAELDERLDALDLSQPYPGGAWTRRGGASWPRPSCPSPAADHASGAAPTCGAAAVESRTIRSGVNSISVCGAPVPSISARIVLTGAVLIASTLCRMVVSGG